MSPRTRRISPIGAPIGIRRVLVSNVLWYVDHADAVTHRHDHVRGAEDFVGDRARELLVGVDAQLRDHGSHVSIDLALDRSPGRMNGNPAFGEQRGERSRDLPPPTAAEANEHDIPGSVGVLALRASDRVKTLAGESVGHQRDEIEHRGGFEDSFNRVVHDLLDLLTVKPSGQLGAEMPDHPVDLVPHGWVQRNVHD